MSDGYDEPGKYKPGNKTKLNQELVYEALKVREQNELERRELQDKVVRNEEGHWVKGQSGNPLGRPKGGKNKTQSEIFRDYMAGYGFQVIEELRAIINNPNI